MSSPYAASRLARLVTETVEALDEVSFPLSVPGINELRASQSALKTQLSTRLLPHLLEDAVPAIVVFGGSSGAGKSTILNSLIGEDVSEASVIRPTTRTPVLVFHPDDEQAMEGHLLTQICDVIVTENGIPGIALIDAPDLDSIDAGNRETSQTLLNAADLWIFVTTASRYGDHVAWSTLTEAYDRGMTTAVVLNRLPARAKVAVRADLMKRMAESGMGESPLFILDDAGPTEGRLEPSRVQELKSWLELIRSTRASKSLVARTSRALMPATRRELLELADAANSQSEAAESLKEGAKQAAIEPTETLRTAITSGRISSGAPTTQWLSLASTGGPLASLVSGRDILFPSRAIAKRDRAATSIAEAIDDALKVTLTQTLIEVRDRATYAWSMSYVDTSELKVEVDIEALVDEAVKQWQADSVAAAGRVSGGIAKKVSTDGLAGLLRAGATGLAGVQTALKSGGAEGGLSRTERALKDRCENAIAGVVERYVAVIDDLEMPDSSMLRLRARELVDAVWEKE
ncbi:MAG: dynamin family protein [Flaviflexus sp.]|uniref:GTPase n=2 Tax=Bacteria TaxID=2 RepID=UPI00352BEEFA